MASKSITCQSHPTSQAHRKRFKLTHQAQTTPGKDDIAVTGSTWASQPVACSIELREMPQASQTLHPAKPQGCTHQSSTSTLYPMEQEVPRSSTRKFQLALSVSFPPSPPLLADAYFNFLLIIVSRNTFTFWVLCPFHQKFVCGGV